MALKITNAASESINSKVQRIKRAACGFRNRDGFRNAILFNLGGLDPYPDDASATHTTSLCASCYSVRLPRSTGLKRCPTRRSSRPAPQAAPAAERQRR
ncbi:MAG: transposase [Phycisphaerae bacterium]